MATCETCKFYKAGYRAGAERGYAWITEHVAGELLPIGRCEAQIPRMPTMSDTQWGWPTCHKDDYCGEWTATP